MFLSSLLYSFQLPLVEEYTAAPSGKAAEPAMEEIKMTLPLPDSFRNGCASWERWKEESKFVAIKLEYSSEVYCVTGFHPGPMPPALLTYHSTNIKK